MIQYGGVLSFSTGREFVAIEVPDEAIQLSLHIACQTGDRERVVAEVVRW